MVNTSAICQQAAHTTYQLSSQQEPQKQKKQTNKNKTNKQTNKQTKLTLNENI